MSLSQGFDQTSDFDLPRGFIADLCIVYMNVILLFFFFSAVIVADVFVVFGYVFVDVIADVFMDVF